MTHTCILYVHIHVYTYVHVGTLQVCVILCASVSCLPAPPLPRAPSPQPPCLPQWSRPPDCRHCVTRHSNCTYLAVDATTSPSVPHPVYCLLGIRTPCTVMTVAACVVFQVRERICCQMCLMVPTLACGILSKHNIPLQSPHN